MTFDSFVFLFRFLPLILILYYLAPGRGKNVVLILGSLVFYAWGEPASVLVILFLSCVNYFLGRLIEANRQQIGARVFLIVSIVMNLFLLFVGGYYDAFMQMLNHLFGVNIPLLELGIPAGIFLYTLRAVSYSVDIYREDAEAQKNFIDYLLYMSFFLQFPAGPIVKYKSVGKNLKRRKIDICAIQRGSVTFVRGLAKKVLLADNLERIWKTVSGYELSSMSLLTAWIGIISFSLMIYYEFAGIAEMAEGFAAFFGFSIPENFDHPYTAVSVTDFWRRWYISLGDWFRDYVCQPIAGRSSKMKLQIPGILAAWFLIGIWSGAGLRYLCWGLWFAFFLIIERLFLGKVLEFFPRIAGRIYTIFVTVMGWVIYAWNDFGGMQKFFSALFGLSDGPVIDRQAMFLLTEKQVILVISLLLCAPCWKWLENRLMKSNSGYGMALHRFLEKAYVLVIFFLSLIYMTVS